MFATAPLTLVLALASPQAPDEVLATYTLDGEQATVTRTDVALEMAFHLLRRERGRSACKMIVDTQLTRREAEKANVMPSRAEVQEFWDKLKKQLIAQGSRPEEFAAVRNTSEREWLEVLAVQLAHERLVRRDLGLAKNERADPDMLKLWLAEARKRIPCEIDPDKLPVGTAARIGKTHVPMIDLGLLLLRTSEDFERDRFIRQFVYLSAIERMAAQRSITVSAADLDRAIDDRRKRTKNSPRGITFEQVLQAEGETLESVRKQRVFRSQVLLDKIALLDYSDEVLQKELQQERRKVLDEVGPRRRIGAIFIRARETPNQLVKRTFEDAMSHLEGVRRRIAKDGFAATASIESEDGRSKKSGGDVGWHRPSSKQLPASVVRAAFAMKMTDVSMPIRTDKGCYVITVLDKEPMPSDKELLRRLRVLRAQQLSESILVDAKIKISPTKN